jgi:hypothetical protein
VGSIKNAKLLKIFILEENSWRRQNLRGQSLM